MNQRTAVGIMVLTATGHILEVDGQLEDSLGYPPGGMAAAHIRELGHPRDTYIPVEDLNRAWRVNRRMLRGDGTYQWVRFDYLPHLVNGRPLGWLLRFLGDAVDHLQTAEIEATPDDYELIASFADRRKVMAHRDQMAAMDDWPVGAIVVAPDGMVRYANAAANDIYGGTLLGIHYSAMMVPEVGERIEGFFTRGFYDPTGERERPGLWTIMRVDGSRIDCRMTGRRVVYHDEVMILVVWTPVSSDKTSTEMGVKQMDALLDERMVNQGAQIASGARMDQMEAETDSVRHDLRAAMGGLKTGFLGMAALLERMVDSLTLLEEGLTRRGDLWEHDDPAPQGDDEDDDSSA